MKGEALTLGPKGAIALRHPDFCCLQFPNSHRAIGTG